MEGERSRALDIIAGDMHETGREGEGVLWRAALTIQTFHVDYQDFSERITVGKKDVV